MNYCARQNYRVRDYKHPGRSGWVISADRAKFRVAQRGEEAEIQNSATEMFYPSAYQMYMSAIDVDPAVSET